MGLCGVALIAAINFPDSKPYEEVARSGSEKMNKRTLVDSMVATRKDWDELMAEVGEARMTIPAIYNGWSVKDVIGHLTYYENWMLGWLEAAVRGRVTVASHQDLMAVDDRNALVWKANSDRSLAEIIKESQSVSDRLLAMVRALPEQDLFDPYRFERYILPFWDNYRLLWECIADDSYLHYQEHATSIREWLKSQPEEDTRVQVSTK